MSTEIDVPEGTNIILNDTQIPDSGIRYFFACLKPIAKVNWIFFDAAELTEELGSKLYPVATGLVFLFPGESSQPIKNQLSLEGFSVPTNRTFSDNKPAALNIRVPQIAIDTQ